MVEKNKESSIITKKGLNMTDTDTIKDQQPALAAEGVVEQPAAQVAAKPQPQKQRMTIDEIKEILLKLTQQYPQCFSITDPKPLKLGIHKDCAEFLSEELKLDSMKRSQTFHFYTKQKSYLQSLQLGAARIDLEGNKTDEVSEEHAQIAANMLEERAAKLAARKAQKANKPKKAKQPAPQNASETAKEEKAKTTTSGTRLKLNINPEAKRNIYQKIKDTKQQKFKKFGDEDLF
jgi:ProP effector